MKLSYLRDFCFFATLMLGEIILKLTRTLVAGRHAVCFAGVCLVSGDEKKMLCVSDRQLSALMG